jgi:uncharacterized protein YgbK (DUF1537 family)
MDAQLPAVFAGLARLGAPVLHYKVCSTFDSSPATGSIGRAIDIGARQMPGAWVPMVVGVPRLGRYQAFGQLFARAADGAIHRLDRHPTMARHPVTPMQEADLRLHLAQQTARRIALIDHVQLRADGGAAQLTRLRGTDCPAVLLDVMDDDALAAVGRLVWEHRGDGIFSASSSGLQYALAAHWRAIGAVPAAAPGLPPAQPVAAIAAVSGSCSPVTAAQIRWARAHGFATERLDIAATLSAAGSDAEVRRCTDRALAALRSGASPLVFSAEGPDDDAVTQFPALARQAGFTPAEAGQRIGQALAAVMRAIVQASGIARIAVAGGDSSGEVAGGLGIAALSATARLAPGAPLCRAWSADARLDGLEIVLKGGQMGGEDFFGTVRAGLA